MILRDFNPADFSSADFATPIWEATLAYTEPFDIFSFSAVPGAVSASVSLEYTEPMDTFYVSASVGAAVSLAMLVYTEPADVFSFDAVVIPDEVVTPHPHEAVNLMFPQTWFGEPERRKPKPPHRTAMFWFAEPRDIVEFKVELGPRHAEARMSLEEADDTVVFLAEVIERRKASARVNVVEPLDEFSVTADTFDWIDHDNAALLVA